MQLYIKSKNILTPILKDPFDLERDMQKLIESNLETVFGTHFVCSEFTIGGFRIDTLAFDEQSNAFVIIEYKRGSSYSVIDQGYSYLSTMLNNKAEFILEYNEKMDRNLMRSEVDWTSSRVLFLSESFTTYQKNSVNFKDVPFELWETRRFEGGLIALEQHQSASNESINKVTGGNPDSVISQVSAEVKKISEEELASKLSEELKTVWSALREKLLEYPDTLFYTTRSYVGWKKGSTTVSFLHFQSKRIRAEILRGNKNEEGEKSKGFFTLDDPKDMSKESGWKWKDGKSGHTYQVNITKIEQLDYVLYLLNQKYDAL